MALYFYFFKPGMIGLMRIYAGNIGGAIATGAAGVIRIRGYEKLPKIKCKQGIIQKNYR
jgi:hypothetical protein